VRRPAAEQATGRPTELPLPHEVEEYLGRLDGALTLPPEVRTDIAAEMADHFRDSIAAIVAEGLDRERAAREAIARMGNPTELAAELSRAHRTTRRLLAGAAGGVFHGAVGGAAGSLAGLAAAVAVGFSAATITGTALKMPTDYLMEHLPLLRAAIHDPATLTAWLAAIACFGAYFAARRGVIASARISRRSIETVRRVWAAAGFSVLALAALFVVPAWQSPVSVPFELLVPVAFAAGALANAVPRISIGRGRAAAAIVVVVILGVSFVTDTPAWPSPVARHSDTVADHAGQLAEFDRVAPAWISPDGHPVLAEGGGLWGSGVISQAVVLWDGSPNAHPYALDIFRDLRFEAWRAVRFGGSPDLEEYVPDPAYTAPFVTLPATFIDGFSSQIDFDVNHVRTTEWIVFVTGTGPDGRRYRLNDPEYYLGGGYLTSCFTGTIWEWLTAGT
jgi:hypothetical protein